MQVSLFMEYKAPKVLQLQRNKQINYQELELLLSRFVGEEKSSASFIKFQCSTDKTQMSNVAYNQRLLQHTENTLASVMGAPSARLVLSSALDGRDIALDEVAVLVEEASSQRQQYSQDLLQSAIENASEGISIVDSELNLVAWNKKYVDLFNYPSELVFQGSPVSDLIRFNILRGLCGVGKVDEQVNKRLMHLRNGSPHSSEREHSDGRVIRIEGNPLPGGGFVMLFSDITVYRQAERGLIEANVDLETRVLERTQKLEQTNDALALARKKAEQSHINKSLYLKACSHDLMQPLEAARLFTSALAGQGNLTTKQQRQVDNIDHSLKVANDLVADLAEISRIESGNIKLNISSFSLKSLFDDIAKEFSASAMEHKVEFRVRSNTMWLRSDRSLLRRILQNLIGNAFRYASPGKILLGARAKGDMVDIQVLDNGPGIPEEKQTMVFEQFTQLDNQQSSSAGGLGLGLNITQSLAKLLDHPLTLSSQVNMGCKFTVEVERTCTQQESVVTKPAVNLGLRNVTVMCIDNDSDVLSGMVELLSVWGCNVLAADSYHQALSIFDGHKNDIEILLVDYQLDGNFNGIALITELRKLSRHYVPAVLITATTDNSLEEKALVADISFMRKLIKPAALRAMMSSMLTKKMQEKYLQ
jgi:signal transduction histidine kinase